MWPLLFSVCLIFFCWLIFAYDVYLYAQNHIIKNYTILLYYLFIDYNKSTDLHYFCDAPVQAYSAALYVRSSRNNNIVTNLLTAKWKIVPNRKLTVLKLELISFSLLSCWIVSVRKALSAQVQISIDVSWADSKIALYWVKPIVCPRLEKM